MRPATSALYSVLMSEAIGDAIRRRIVPMIVFIALISLLAVDSCTSCASGNVSVNGQNVAVAEIGGWTGMLLFTSLALWTMVLAGLLASDHLAEPLADGSANLVLARPIQRHEFAAARLAGALVIALLAGAVVLTGTALLLNLRNGLPLIPALWAGLACAAGSLVVGSTAMALSLVLTRIATALSVLAFVGAVAFINSFTLFGVSMGGAAALLQHVTPPLCTAIVVALAPWTDPIVPNVDPMLTILKLVAWMVAGVLLLMAVFRRQEIAA